MEKQHCDWLVVAFVHEVYNLTTISDEIINALAAAGSGENNIVYLIKDSVSHPAGSGTGDDGKVVNIFNLSVQLLVKDPATASYAFKQQDVPIDNEDRNCWQTGFKYIYNNISAKRRMLISFSHGAAFGINWDIGRVERPGPTTNPVTTTTSPAITTISNQYFFLDNNDVQQIEANYIDGIAPPDERTRKSIRKGELLLDKSKQFCSKLELLWISDVAKALKELLGGEKIDLLVMNNCYMQNFETGYILHEVANYMLAPEGSMDGTGYDYKSLMERINDKPDIDLEELFKDIIADYVLYYRARNLEDSLSKQAIFINNLQVYPKALELYGRFLDILSANLDDIRPVLQNLRERKILYVSADVDNYPASNYLDLVDAYQWVKLVLDRLKDSLFKDSSLPDEFVALGKEMKRAENVGDFLIRHDQNFEAKF
ncbi:MAG: hypothetical protein JST42_21695, partial [Bacteroidetes bacterium]|nr:hypothetical protein [Bacteroidota bacterium]